MQSHRQLLMGLPGAGKTTFLAALWHAVESDEIQSALKLIEVHGTRDYLNKIRQDWLNCRPLERTLVAAEKIVSMKLTDRKGERTGEVFFPDMSGESFRNQWRMRQWTKSYYEMQQAANGALLFIHPDTIVEPTRIDEADKLISELASAPTELVGLSNEDNWVPWSPTAAPTQVQLVELMQFLVYYGNVTKPFRLGLIISAWDLVAPLGMTPKDWLDVRLPLLAQFLKCNSEDLPFRVYGISAQGGDFPKDSQRLLQHSRQSERILVVGADCEPHDITAPVSWLIS